MLSIDDTKKFLKWLLKEDQSIILQFFGDGAQKGNKSLAHKYTKGGKRLLEIIEQYQSQGAGAYIQINAGSDRGAKNITAIRAVFLDLDGAPLQPIKDAVKAGTLAKPHIIVESSPGRYHVYWRCSDATLQNFAYIQRTLAQRFDGDTAVFDLSRVLRLPGSLNYKYNREGDRVKILYYQPEEPPCLAEDLVKQGLAVGTTGEAIAPQALASLHNALDTLSNSLDIQGHAPSPLDTTELKPGDRTQRIIAIAGALVGSNPDATLAELKKMLVSEVDKRTALNDTGPSATAWESEIFPGLERFVERRDAEFAKMRAIDDKLAETYEEEFTAFQEARTTEAMTLQDFADRFVLVASQKLVYDLEKAPAQSAMTLEAFKVYASVFKAEGTPILNQWIKNRALRKTVAKVTYRPYAYTNDPNKQRMQRIVRDEDTAELCYNTYTPTKLLPLHRPTAEAQAILKPFLDHISYLFMNEERANQMLDWLAACVQYPAKRVLWAPLVVTTHEGVGKGFVAQVIKQLVGATNYKMITADALGVHVNFNDFLVNCSVLCVDEVYMPKQASFKNRLNAMITEPQLEINRKHGTKLMENLYCNFICFSNHIDAIDLSVNDRRFWVHIFREKPKGADYYRKLFAWMESTRGLAVLFQWLLDRDISKFNWGQCPRFDDDSDKQSMFEANLSETETKLNAALADKEGPFAGGITCMQLVENWLEIHERVELGRDARHELRRWLRRYGRSVGRLSAIPSQYRHATWYAVDEDIRVPAKARFLSEAAAKSLRAATGDSTMHLVSEG